MRILDAFVGETRSQLGFREAGLARCSDRANIGQPFDASRFQRPDEPINVGSLIANREYNAHA
jgi:hypothetical protein